MLRLIGLTLLIASVALVAYDAAVYFKRGREFVFMSAEGLWNLFGGQRLFELRPTLTSWFGSVGDAITGLPAVAIIFVLGLVLAWIGQRSAARGT